MQQAQGGPAHDHTIPIAIAQRYWACRTTRVALQRMKGYLVNRSVNGAPGEAHMRGSCVVGLSWGSAPGIVLPDLGASHFISGDAQAWLSCAALVSLSSMQVSPAVRVSFPHPARAARAFSNPCQARRIVGDRRNHDRSNGRSQPIRYTSNNTAGPKNAQRSSQKSKLHWYDKMSRHAMAVYKTKLQVRHLLP